MCGSGRREEEAEQAEQTRDTESKTRTPHKVVGKTRSLALLLEVQMSKKCTSLWREVHFEVKMYKTQVRTTFGGSDVVSCGRRKGFKSEQNVRVL